MNFVSVLCDVGDRYVQIMDDCEKSGDFSIGMLSDVIPKIKFLEGINGTCVQQLKKLLQELKDRAGTEDDPNVSWFQKLLQPNTTTSIRAVKPPPEVFVQLLKSFLKELVPNIRHELGSQVADQIIEILRQQDVSAPHQPQFGDIDDRNVRMAFEMIKKKCEKKSMQENPSRSYDC